MKKVEGETMGRQGRFEARERGGREGGGSDGPRKRLKCARDVQNHCTGAPHGYSLQSELKTVGHKEQKEFGDGLS